MMRSSICHPQSKGQRPPTHNLSAHLAFQVRNHQSALVKHHSSVVKAVHTNILLSVGSLEDCQDM